MLNQITTPQCYTRKEVNPYHIKLGELGSFVYLDHEAEKFKGKWSSEVFNNFNPIIVEIGVGYGDFMMNYCLENPNHNYIGMDIRFKRSFGVAKKIKSNALTNIRFLRAQGQRLPFLFNEHEIDTLFCFFPDPWPRKKQHKKRILQKSLLQKIGILLKPKGHFCFKTDHLEMFQWVLEELAQCPNLKIIWQTFDLYKEAPLVNDENVQKLLTPMVTFQTKFEKIFLQQNTPIKAIIICPQN